MAMFASPAASAAPDLSVTSLAADPTFPPPRCIPQNQLESGFQWVYVKTRTLSGNGESVRIREFEFSRVPSPQDPPSVFPPATVTCHAKPDPNPPAGPKPVRPPAGEVGSGLGI
jgi:hypothetical protein